MGQMRFLVRDFFLNTMKQPFFLFLYLLGPWLFLQAQIQEVSLPEIDPYWLEQDQIEEAGEAPAYIVQDFGAVEFETMGSSPKARYTYQRRIKILDEAGLKYRRVFFTYRTKEFRELVVSAEGATLGLNPEGEIVRFEVKKRNIYEDNLGDGTRRLWFDLPFVKPGSVIEYKIVLSSAQLETLRPWYFQDTLPVHSSEFHAWIPSAYEYLISTKGNVRALETDQSRFRPENFHSPVPQRIDGTRPTGYAGQNPFASLNTGTHFSYSMENVPPIVREEFSPETNDYVPSIHFHLARNRLTNRSNPNIFANWDELNRKVQKPLKVKKARLNRNTVKDLVQKYESDQSDDLETAQALYEFVRSKFTWEDAYSLDIGNLNAVLERRRGNGAEINLVLLHLLRNAGLQVNPVLISTREHGKVSSVIANTDQFNHLILRLTIKGRTYLLDALSDHKEFGVLPKNDLNQMGFQLSGTEGKWIRLANPGNTLNRTTYTRFTLNQEGHMEGEISVINKGYRAALERERIKDYSDPSDSYFRQHVLLGLDEYQLLSPKVNNSQNTEEPLVLECELVTKGFTELAGEFMFVRPILAWPILDNPFPQTERMTPVDLTFPRQEAYMLGLILPDGYEVEQLPQPIKVMMPNNGGVFTFNVFKDGNILHLTSVLQLNQTLFLPEEYESVRSFFDFITTKHEEGIVLRKIQ
jgi:hypothetical protein